MFVRQERQGRYGMELSDKSDISQSLERSREVSQTIPRSVVVEGSREEARKLWK